MEFPIDPRRLLAEHHRRTVNAVSGRNFPEKLSRYATDELAAVADLIEALPEDFSQTNPFPALAGIERIDALRLALGIEHDLGEQTHV